MKIITILLLLLPYFWASASDPYPINPNIDVLHYKFKIELNDTTNILEGTAEITILFKKLQAKLVLDLVVRGKDGLGMTVRNVMHRYSSISFSHKNDQLELVLRHPPKAGEQRTYQVQYSGVPADGLIIGENKFGDRTFFSDNWPNRARHWLPSIDHPSDKASCEFMITAPSHYQVVGNGIKVEQTNMHGHRTLTHWKEEKRLPTKVMVIGVARFSVAIAGYSNSSIPVTTWVYPQNKNEGFSDFSIAPKVVDYFQDHIAPYPYQKLANVQSKTRYGGMENASAIFYFEDAVTGKGEQENLIAHEVAHQWFGNSLSELDWHHIWLSEGFATYFTNLYIEHTYGFDKLKIRMGTQRQQVIDYYKKNPKPVIDTTVTNINNMLNPNSYQKGAWVLHMLRHKVGDAVFWKGVQAYYKKYSNSNALTSDFMKVMEEVSGVALAPFFDQWLRRSGHPILSVQWKYDLSSKLTHIEVTQKQYIPFEISLDIGIKGSESIFAIHTININDKTNKFSLPTSNRPVALTLDPNMQLLFEGKIDN